MSKEQKRPQIIPEQIHMLNVVVFKGSLEADDTFMENPKPVDGFRMSTKLELANSIEQGLTRVRLFILLEAATSDEEVQGLTADYGIEFVFKVDNFSDFVQGNPENGIQIDAMIGGTLVGIAFSTARGILMERLHGTYFGRVILPIVDPVELLKESVEVEGA